MLNYKEFLKNQEQSPEKTYIVIFKGSVDPKTNMNWCSDCRKAEPNINKILKPFCQENKIRVYSVQVGLKDEWKDKNHLLRKNKFFRLTGVPTLIYVNNEMPIIRLVEDDLSNVKIMESFLKELI